MASEREKSISLRISKEEKEKLIEQAEKEERSVSQVIRLAIKKYLEENN